MRIYKIKIKIPNIKLVFNFIFGIKMILIYSIQVYTLNLG